MGRPSIPEDPDRVCLSCGLCYVRWKHTYAIYEHLPEGWPYKSVTFLICKSCGVAHAVEHAAQQGMPDRLRARRETVFLPVSPAMRRSHREDEQFLRQKAKAAQNPEKPRSAPPVTVQPVRPLRINLLPSPPAKRALSDFGWRIIEKLAVWCLAPFWLPYVIFLFLQNQFEEIQDSLWKKPSLEEWQKEKPIRVTSPDTYDQRVQQLHRLHQHYEALLPIVQESLPISEGSSEAERYGKLACSVCGVSGSLVEDLPEPDVKVPPFFVPPECPVCKCLAVTDDYSTGIDVQVYLTGDTLFNGLFDRREWIREFSSDTPPRSETAILRIENGELKPCRIQIQITAPFTEEEPQIWLPPGHTYDVYLKSREEEPDSENVRVACWLKYEIISVMEGEKLIYGTRMPSHNRVTPA